MKRVGESKKWVARPRGGKSKKNFGEKLFDWCDTRVKLKKDLITYVDKPTTVQQGGVGLGYVRVQAKGKQDRRRVTGKTDT